MLATSTTMTTTYGASVGAYGSGEGAGHGSHDDDQTAFSSLTTQSKLRAILRDQSRREEQKHQAAVNGTSHSRASKTDEPFLFGPIHASTSTSAMQALQGAASKQDAARTRRPSLVSSVSAAVLGSDPARQRKDSQARRSGSKLSSQLEALSAMSSSSPSSVSKVAETSSPMQRQRSLRQTPQPVECEPEVVSPPPGSARLVRSRSTTAGGNLSGGVDLKVVILGAQGVGKTSLVHRYTSGHFSASAVPSTIGASFLTKKLIVDGIKVRLQLWDTAGQERFRSMAPMYYRGANAAVIVYDITNPRSFEDVKTWIDELRQNVQSDLIIHIVGSKLDLARHHRQVELEEARQAVHQWSTPAEERESARTKQAPSAQASNSLFGSRRGLTASTSFFQHGGSPPASPPSHIHTSPSYPVVKLAGLSQLSSRSNRAGTDANEVDGHSDPSTAASSYGGAQLSASDPGYIDVSEVSAKDNEGIEDVFVGIATRLVERKEELEARELARKRQDRESVFLSADHAYDVADGTPQASWCCST